MERRYLNPVLIVSPLERLMGRVKGICAFVTVMEAVAE